MKYIFFFEVNSKRMLELLEKKIFDYVYVDISDEKYHRRPFDLEKMIDTNLINSIFIDIKKILPDFNGINIYRMEICYGQIFEFLIIHFELKENKDYPNLKEKICEFKELFNNYPQIVRQERILSSIYFTEPILEAIRNDLRTQFDQYTLKDFQINPHLKLSDFPWIFGINNNSFMIEIEKIFPFKLNIKHQIIEYYKKFPNMLNDREPEYDSDILIGDFNIENIREIEDENFFENLCLKIEREIWDKVGQIYSNSLKFFIDRFQNVLLNLTNIIIHYDYKTLQDLKSILINFQEDYFKNRIIFIRAFDEHGISYSKRDLTGKVFFEDIPKNIMISSDKYPNFYSIAENFLNSYYSLQDVLNKTLDNINSQILSKGFKIKSFRKEELKDKLENVSKEEDFSKNIIIPILRDFNFQNIQYTHGSNENGVDIIFNNTNCFNIVEWNAMVVKTKDINLKEGVDLNQRLESYYSQINQAKIMPHNDPNHGSVRFTRIFLVTNGTINYHAQQAFLRKNPLIEGNIFFIQKSTLLELF